MENMLELLEIEADVKDLEDAPDLQEKVCEITPTSVSKGNVT